MLAKIAHVNGGAIVPAIHVLDPLIHTARQPYCKDLACPCQADRKPRHRFTKEEARRGGKRRQQLPNAHQHQQMAYETLKWRKPGVALWIYEQRIKPRYQRDGSPED